MRAEGERGRERKSKERGIANKLVPLVAVLLAVDSIIVIIVSIPPVDWCCFGLFVASVAEVFLVARSTSCRSAGQTRDEGLTPHDPNRVSLRYDGLFLFCAHPTHRGTIPLNLWSCMGIFGSPRLPRRSLGPP